MARPSFARDATPVRMPNYALVYGYLVVAFAIAVTGFTTHTGGVSWMPLALSGAVVGQLMRRLRTKSARLSATEEGLWLDDRLAIARRRVRQALVLHERGEMWVRLSGTKLVDVNVADDAEAQALLRAMALDVKSTTATFSLATRSLRTGIIAAAVGVMTMLGGVCFALIAVRPMQQSGIPVVASMVMIMLAFAVLLVTLLSRATVKLVVGADGIRIREGVGRWTFLSHDRLQSVAAESQAIVLKTTDGAERRYQLGDPRKRAADRVAAVRQADAIARRINDARDARNADGDVSVEALARAGRSGRAWLEDLRRIGAGASAAFRESPVTRDRLFRVLESANAPVAQRVAAAVALRRGDLDEDERARVRIVPEQCARLEDRARLRVAVAEDDEASLIEALEASSDPEGRRSAKLGR